MNQQNAFQFEIYSDDDDSSVIKSNTESLIDNSIKTSESEKLKEQLRKFYASLDVPKVTIMMVTPEMANKMLSENPNNRNIRQSGIDKTVNAILTKKWRCTHQGIAFDKDGKLIDGQHRLKSIIRTGIAIPMMVSTGCDRDAPIDVGVKRTTIDSLNMGGHSETIKTSFDAALFKSFFPKSWSDDSDRFGEASNFFPDEFDFIRRHFNKSQKRIRTSIVASAIFLAYYHLKKNPLKIDRLIKFCEILVDGSSEGFQDASAIKLRDYLLTDKAHGDRQKIISSVQTHLRLFIDKVDVRKKNIVVNGYVYVYPESAPFFESANVK